LGRTLAVSIGLICGLLLAGAAVGLLLPQLPPAWRSEPLVWAVSTVLVALCAGAAFVASRPSRRWPEGERLCGAFLDHARTRI